MSAIGQRIQEIENQPIKPCRCGKPQDLVRTMLSIHTGKHVRMFECSVCHERTWDDD
ncbi:hypothetical protein ACVW1C_004257 [Bradyrhizobium sp. USDA 4011]